jgi:NADPH-dependent F420 reductase
MNIAILGGTGKLGLALAGRFHRCGHGVVIGSRDAAKAAAAAASVGDSVRGATNIDAVVACAAAFIAIPYSGHRALIESVAPYVAGKIVVDTTVPIDAANILQVRTESGRSAAEEVAAAAPAAHVFAAFHTISHRIMRRADEVHDTLVAGDGERKSELMDLIRSINLRPVDAGPLDVAGHLERLTTLLLSINRANKIKESGIKITGI